MTTILALRTGNKYICFICFVFERLFSPKTSVISVYAYLSETVFSCWLIHIWCSAKKNIKYYHPYPLGHNLHALWVQLAFRTPTTHCVLLYSNHIRALKQTIRNDLQIQVWCHSTQVKELTYKPKDWFFWCISVPLRGFKFLSCAEILSM